MTAQYRPYRDEESVDGLEAIAWTDNEPGSIQIYEKTTEELPFSPSYRKTVFIHIALFMTGSLLGFLLGYFVEQKDFIHSEQSEFGDQSDFRNTYENDAITHELSSKINGQRILDLLTKYKETNRIPGSDTDHEFAQYIQETFTQLAFDSVTATNFTFRTMLPLKPAVVRLLNRENKTLYSNIDLESYPHDDMRPFLPLSQAEATNLTTSQVIYVNKGSKDDYLKLNSFGLGPAEIEGKVFVVRQTYYQAHDVVVSAQESGAKAILMFPDPDTYGATSPFPKSLHLNNDAGRSHPLAWSNYGDLASYNFSLMTDIDTSKLSQDKDFKIIIPVIMISYNTAQKLLRGLSGVQAPNEWNCFDFTLHLGPNYKEENNEDQRNKIKIEFHNQETSVTSTTVVGTISGSVEPDRYIVIGSRRDSLNRGLLDSVSGSAVMLEVARAFGDMLKRGWRPRRTIVFSSFGAESLNLIGSSYWLDEHQRILGSRAVAYVNCDLVVTGNRSISIAASPLLFQVVFNSTKAISNPNSLQYPQLASLYDAWKDAHHFDKDQFDAHKSADSGLEKILDDALAEYKLTRASEKPGDEDDPTAAPGSILHDYRKSATTKTRPKVRHLDLHSIYSPFLLYAGIPVVDVRFGGFLNQPDVAANKSLLVEETLPLIGTKYDNLDAIQLIDPHLGYHMAVARTVSEIVRDLGDSIFLPFNLLEYAVILRGSFTHFVAHHGDIFAKWNVDLGSLQEIIEEFAHAAIKFHHRQDLVSLKDSMKIRKFNDQLIQLERAFLDTNSLLPLSKRKHIILSPNEGQAHHVAFPALVDWITLLDDASLNPTEQSLFVDILKVHYKFVIETIARAIKIIEEVHIL